MADKSAIIVIYSKAATFEEDLDDNTIHTVLDTLGMEVRVIQTRANFNKTGRRADRFRKSIASQEAEIVKLSKRGPMFLREDHRED